MNWLLLTTVLANPVPTVKSNPYMTEDECKAIMVYWEIGKEWRGNCVPEPTPAVATDNAGYWYRIGLNFGNPRRHRVGQSNVWITNETPVSLYQFDPPGFSCYVAGPYLESLLRELAVTGAVKDKAKAQEFLRRK